MREVTVARKNNVLIPTTCYSLEPRAPNEECHTNDGYGIMPNAGVCLSARIVIALAQGLREDRNSKAAGRMRRGAFRDRSSLTAYPIVLGPGYSL